MTPSLRSSQAPSAASTPSARRPRLLPLLLAAACATPASALRCHVAIPATSAITGVTRPLSAPVAVGAASASPLRRRVAPPAMQVPASEKPSPVPKQQLIDMIAVKAGVSKKTAGLVLKASLDVIVDSVCQGNKVSLLGFGSFSSKERPERQARNPQTGAPMTIAAARVPSFSFGKSFKDAVKEAGNK